MFYALRILYRWTIALTQQSILLLYRRIFDTNRFKFRVLCRALFGYVTLYAISSIAVTVFECTPIALEWDKSLPGSCINFPAFWHANGVHNLLSDLAILLLPMPVIHTLNLPLPRKVGLMAVFALGLLYVFSSLLI